MLQVENLSVRFGAQVALEGVSFRVQSGEIVLVTGPSGCGKTTLARSLNGLIPHHSLATMGGRVLVDGLDTRQHPVAALAGHVGLVGQHPEAQLFNLTVEEEVAFGPRNLRLAPAEVARRVEGALADLGLETLRHRAPHTLSAGEKERLAIASVLAMAPRLLVLDEPAANLDVAATGELRAALERLARRGLAVVILDHKMGDLARLASRLLVLERGRIVREGPPERVLADRALLSRLGLRRPAHERQTPWRHLIAPRPHPVGGPPLLELKGVVAGYGHEPVLRGVDLALAPGEMAALVGDNGAGKSTLARVASGVLAARGGEIRLAGVRRRPRAGSLVALLLESPDEQLFCDTVEEEVRFGQENLGRLDPPSVEEALVATGLEALRHASPHTLSLGQRQRTVLAALLALRPRLLILDEPTLGQDWGHLSRFMEAIRRLNARGTTVLLITHDYKLVHQYARRVLLLEGGRIVADGAPRGRPAAGTGG